MGDLMPLPSGSLRRDEVVNREDVAKYEYLRNGLRLLREAKERCQATSGFNPQWVTTQSALTFVGI